ncbi:MAG: hypothetical protein NNA22_05310 [Nitrospira sp.]|nr:hypothetical protein [Nitrospira sp.]
MKIQRPARHTGLHGKHVMQLDERCRVPNCQGKPYAPAGTGSVCKDHFLHFLAWRRKRGAQMFHTYAAMTMEERDTIIAEWMKTLPLQDVPSTAPVV